MGFSNDTLLAAMQMLVAHGGLQRQSGRGTEIRDLDALLRINWTVGIAGLSAPDSGPGAFYGAVLYRLLSRLSRANCRCNTYFRSEKPQWPHRLPDFPGLEGDVADEALDGLILLTSLDARQCRAIERNGTPVCHVGFWETMPHATVIDRYAMVVDAMALLAARGARRPALLTGGMDQLLSGAQARDRVTDGCARAALAACEGISISPAPGAATAVARQLCTRRKAQRPDALILTDDYAAQAVAEVLAAQADYRPLLVASTTRQLPLVFALPVIRFELDLDELADRAITKFRRRLLDPAADGGSDYVKAQACETD
jgi:hypothetical protein